MKCGFVYTDWINNEQKVSFVAKIFLAPDEQIKVHFADAMHFSCSNTEAIVSVASDR